MNASAPLRSPQGPEKYRFAQFSVDPATRSLCNQHGQINLSARAFDVLLELLRHRGEPVSKDHLLDAVWPGVVVGENSLNQAVCTLRKVLGDSRSSPRFVKTIPGRGYCFIAELSDDRATTDTEEKLNAAPQLREPQAATDLPSRWSLRHAPLIAAATLVAFVLIAGTAWLISGFVMLRDAADAPARSPGVSIAAVARSAQPSIVPNSIAVMPFENLNAAPDEGLFAIGLHDELINQLSSIRDLSVIARENVLPLADRQATLSEIGQMLSVETVITGTITYTSDKARVSLKMQDPASGITLWTENYDSDTSSIDKMFETQGEIAINSARALQAELNLRDRTTPPTLSLEAYRYLLAARNAYFYQDYTKTWNLSRLAIAHDPDYADAHNLFSYVNTVMVALPLEGLSPQDHYTRALESAQRVIELTPDSVDGYALRASALASTGGWREVREEVDRMLANGADLADLKFYAPVLMALGDFDGAVRILEENMLTEPVNLYGRGFLMAAHELAGNRDLARREYAIGEELNQNWWGDTVNVFLAMGRGEPVQDIENLYISPLLASVLHNLDDPITVAEGLQAFRNDEIAHAAALIYYSAVAAHADDHELAMEFMRGAVEQAALNIQWSWLPVFDETRNTQAFTDMLREYGVVDYWNEYGWPEVCRRRNDDAFECSWQAYPQESSETP